MLKMNVLQKPSDKRVVIVEIKAPIYWWLEACKLGLTQLDDLYFSIFYELQAGGPLSINDDVSTELMNDEQTDCIKKMLEYINTALNRWRKTGNDMPRYSVLHMLPMSLNISSSFEASLGALDFYGELALTSSSPFPEWDEFVRCVDKLHAAE